MMVTVQVKGGTPRQSDTLCRTCRFAQIIKGFSASQEDFFCAALFKQRRITFAVFECSMYEDKRLANKKDMEDIAWFLTTRKSGRSIGFVSAAKFRELQLEEADSTVIQEEKTESTE